MIHRWLVAFALTLAVETPLAAALLRRTEPSLARRAGLIFFANLATHPAVWFVFPRLGLSWGRQTALAELWAVSLEMVFYSLAFPSLGGRRAALVSLLANAASAGIGFVVAALGGL